MFETPVRTLTAGTGAGLCNRLRVLLSGMALAEATGRRFTMLWPRTPDCSAAFTDLFDSPWPVREVAAREVKILRRTFGHWHSAYDPLIADAADLCIISYSWLLAPDRFPAHGPLMRRCEEMLESMQPATDIQKRVDAFRRSAFRPRMIGVHLRRADLQLGDPIAAANTQHAMSAVDACLEQYPDAGIFLCTDDGAIHQYTGKSLPLEGVRAKFRRRYGDRVVFTVPRSLDRREPVAIRDALVDLWLLRRTHCFVGTGGSSFSRLAAFGRTVPVTFCRSRHPLRHLIPVLHWLRGHRRLRWLAGYYWRGIRLRVVRSLRHN